MNYKVHWRCMQMQSRKDVGGSSPEVAVYFYLHVCACSPLLSSFPSLSFSEIKPQALISTSVSRVALCQFYKLQYTAGISEGDYPATEHIENNYRSAFIYEDVLTVHSGLNVYVLEGFQPIHLLLITTKYIHVHLYTSVVHAKAQVWINAFFLYNVSPTRSLQLPRKCKNFFALFLQYYCIFIAQRESHQPAEKLQSHFPEKCTEFKDKHIFEDILWLHGALFCFHPGCFSFICQENILRMMRNQVWRRHN